MRVERVGWEVEGAKGRGRRRCGGCRLLFSFA